MYRPATTPEWNRSYAGATKKITVGYNAARLASFESHYVCGGGRSNSIKGEVWQAPATPLTVFNYKNINR